MEEVREADGHHQALLWLPCYRSELAADGTIWGKTINRLEETSGEGTARALVDTLR